MSAHRKNELTDQSDARQLAALLDGDHPLKRQAVAWATANPASGHEFDRSWWLAAGSAGYIGLLIPSSYGGQGLGVVDALLSFEGLGCGTNDTGMVFALASQVFAMQSALSGSGSDEQKQQWLPRLCRGEVLGSFAMTEPDAGSDPAAITTLAVANDDGSFVLNGTKAWVTLGPISDVVIVFAQTDPAKGRWGITAFLVPSDTPGFNPGPVIAKSGLQNCPFGQIDLVDCHVGPGALIGAVGSGMSIFSAAVEAERAFLYAAQLGVMERLIAQSTLRARTRQQSGHSIGQFQAISHMIAEMQLRHEAARLLVYKAGVLFERSEPVAMAAALAKLATSEAAVLSSIDALRIHGAEGYTVDAGFEMDVRDALGGLAYSGTSEIQRNIVARLLGVDRPLRTVRNLQSGEEQIT